MSHFCQFCDKEMRLELSVVYIKDYITCGAKKCADQARSNDKYYKSEVVLTIVPADVIIFSTTDPARGVWTAVKKEDHPDFIKDPEILEIMLNGDTAQLEGSEIFYAAQMVEDVQSDIGASKAFITKDN